MSITSTGLDVFDLGAFSGGPHEAPIGLTGLPMNTVGDWELGQSSSWDHEFISIYVLESFADSFDVPIVLLRWQVDVGEACSSPPGHRHIR